MEATAPHAPFFAAVRSVHRSNQVSNSTETKQATPRSRRLDSAAERTVRLNDDRQTSKEIQAALDTIPASSVTARTAGALRVAGPPRTIAEERAAFEQEVAEENARQSEG